ncbi:MAG: hypothetical protein JWM16_2397 [Verrucomicrobiales bacterium]|nr:hypothetical protein [Verrucomicrobiales bacterium]
MKRKQPNLSKKPKPFRCCAPFVPPPKPSTEGPDYLHFLDALALLRAEQRKRKMKELLEHEQALKLFPEALDMFLEALKPGADLDALQQKMGKLLKNPAHKKVVSGMIKQSVSLGSTSLEARSLEASQLKRDEKQLKERQKHVYTINRTTTALEHIAKEALAGNQEAFKCLFEITQFTGALFQLASLAKPELAQSLAKWSTTWPLLISKEAHTSETLQKHLAGLQLGSGLVRLAPEFRRARGADENYPSRMWAKNAVQAIYRTRHRFLMFGDITLDMETVTDLLERGGYDIERSPAWVRRISSLDVFSKGELKAWTEIIRDLIREECPDFHLHPHWQNVRRTCSLQGRNTKGEIQNAVLDDIINALRTLAP